MKPPHTSHRSLALKIIASIILIEILGGLGALATTSAIPSWYATLTRPPGTPPNWIFGPVWTLLYALIATSLALVLHRAHPGPARRTALTWFAVQLTLNVLWSPVFFAAQQIAPALIIITALLVTIVITIKKFRPLDPLAARLLIPYLLWVTYATYLNAGYWILNR